MPVAHAAMLAEIVVVDDDWTPWLPVDDAPRLSPAVLAELLDGGQAFRWHACENGSWRGAWGGCVAELRARPADGQLEWRSPLELAARVEPALAGYLPDASALTAAIDALPWRSDAVLARAIHRFPGLGILRQPLGEVLLGFLCSATKRIPQIKQMVGRLAARFGQPLHREVRALPDWPALASIAEPDLRACGLGFRARFVHRTAQVLAAEPDRLAGLSTIPYQEARDRLTSLPGIGDKVADCVLLFGAGRLDAFPVDTWILRALRRRYGLDGWRLPQVAQFGRVHFGPAAGLAQQYLFALERSEPLSRRSTPSQTSALFRHHSTG